MLVLACCYCCANRTEWNEQIITVWWWYWWRRNAPRAPTPTAKTKKIGIHMEFSMAEFACTWVRVLMSELVSQLASKQAAELWYDDSITHTRTVFDGVLLKKLATLLLQQMKIEWKLSNGMRMDGRTATLSAARCALFHSPRIYMIVIQNLKAPHINWCTISHRVDVDFMRNLVFHRTMMSCCLLKCACMIQCFTDIWMWAHLRPSFRPPMLYTVLTSSLLFDFAVAVAVLR